MHERQAALNGAILALTLSATAAVHAENDAATRTREGEINHWIEYYRKNQQPPPVAPVPQGAAKKVAPRERSGTDAPTKP
jgi:hypothetical protein